MRQHPDRDRGASAIEYVLLVTGVALVLLVVILTFFGHISNMFDDSCDQIANQTGQSACN